ncbi:hypothetical protein [Obesumbacterium proteus]|uniref:hypothetical protein n=1 Tax=Obesumbacterium proteus TaxID=82983 RepID=UPI001F0A4663|nr:hypothetical protein [Obesumbacterium proteus]
MGYGRLDGEFLGNIVHVDAVELGDLSQERIKFKAGIRAHSVSLSMIFYVIYQQGA